jgi:hypothetical protein
MNEERLVRRLARADQQQCHLKQMRAFATKPHEVSRPHIVAGMNRKRRTTWRPSFHCRPPTMPLRVPPADQVRRYPRMVEMWRARGQHRLDGKVSPLNGQNSSSRPGGRFRLIERQNVPPNAPLRVRHEESNSGAIYKGCPVRITPSHVSLRVGKHRKGKGVCLALEE